MVRNIPPAQAAQWLLERPEFRLIDVREPWEWEAVHLEHAHLFPMSQIVKRFKELPHGHPLIMLCHHGIRSYAMAVMLEQNGFHEVYNVRGGIDAWAQEVDNSLARY
jgi:rhodanese-related sulfurtransferase